MELLSFSLWFCGWTQVVAISVHGLQRQGKGLVSSDDPLLVDNTLSDDGFALYSQKVHGKFWYVHIPVCAGRSISKGLKLALEIGTGQEGQLANAQYDPKKSLVYYNFVWGGHAPWADAYNVNQALRKAGKPTFRPVFTMRHPFDRVESWVYNQYDAPPRNAFLSRHKNGTNATGALDNAKEVRNLQNMMVWMLGDQMLPHLRTKTISEALESAKQVVKNAAFVGFVEDLPHSYFALLAKMGLPIAGGLPHIKTRRPAPPAKTDAILNLLHSWNQYDLELYNYARSIWASAGGNITA